jgi:hypothetical protein
VVEDALADVCDLAVLPIVVAVVFRQNHLVKGGSSPLAGHPQQDPRPGQALLDVEGVAVQRDAPIAVGGPRHHRLGEGAGQFLFRKRLMLTCSHP